MPKIPRVGPRAGVGTPALTSLGVAAAPADAAERALSPIVNQQFAEREERIRRQQRLELNRNGQKVTEALNRLDVEFAARDDYETFPGEYSARAQEELDGITSGVADDDVRDALTSEAESRLSTRNRANGLRAVGLEREAAAGVVATRIDAESAAYAFADDAGKAQIIDRTEAMLSQAREEGDISEAAYQALLGDFTQKRSVAHAMQLRRTDPQEAKRQLADPDNPFLKDMDPVTRERLLDSIKDEINLADAMAIDRAKSELEIGVSRGEIGEDTIKEAFESGLINGDERTSLIKSADKFAEEDRLRRFNDNRVSNAITGLGTLDPATDKAVIDDFYERNIAPAIDANPEMAPEVWAEFSKSVGRVPTPIAGRIRGLLRSGDDEGVLFAADAIDRLASGEPALLQDFSPRHITFGTHVANLQRLGMEPAKAVQFARESEKQPKEEIAERERAYSFEQYRNENPDELDEVLDDMDVSGSDFVFDLFGAAAIPDQLGGEYEVLVNDAFLRTGDIDVARESANRTIRRVWGMTEVNGEKQWMKYPPEIYYRTNAGTDWIREQFESELGGLLPKGVEPESLRLVVDTVTARHASGGNPSYGVMYADEAGELLPLLEKNGEPVAGWMPNYKESPAFAEAQKSSEKRLESTNVSIGRARQFIAPFSVEGKQ